MVSRTLTAHPSFRRQAGRAPVPGAEEERRHSSARDSEGVPANALRHTTLAIARLRFLFIAARLRRHAGQVSVSYSDQYEEKTTFSVLMDRLRKIRPRNGIFSPVIDLALT